MKHIKQFEAVRFQPKIGDYVLCELNPDDNENDEKFSAFVENNIGQIVKRNVSEVENKGKKRFLYYIQYKNITNEDYTSSYCKAKDCKDIFVFWRHEIKTWAKDKEDLEHFLIAKKYNL